MRCLILSPVAPAPPDDGAKQRIYHLARGLAQAHDVELLVLANGATPTERLRDLGLPYDVVQARPSRPAAALLAVGRRTSLYQSLHHSRAFARHLSRKLSQTRYDVVQCEFSYMAQYRDLIRALRHEVWVLDEHNLEYRLNDRLAALDTRGSGLLYRTYARRERSYRHREELAAWRLMDHVLTVSDIERDLILQQQPEARVSVVPNGVDLSPPALPARGASCRPSAVFVGKMDYRPNVDAVEWFCTEVLPKIREAEPAFEFSIVGGSPTKDVRLLGRLAGVSVTGWVEDTHPHLSAASVVVAPLRAGSGTRLKILEALGLGRPVVTTPIGCEGLAVTPDVHLLIASSGEEFAAAVIRLVRDRELREALGRHGRALVESRYGWEQVTKRLRDIYSEIAASRASRAN